MYENKMCGEHMTAFAVDASRVRKRGLTVKKKSGVGCLRSCVLLVVVMGKSMVGLEGKYKGKEKVVRGVCCLWGQREYL